MPAPVERFEPAAAAIEAWLEEQELSIAELKRHDRRPHVMDARRKVAAYLREHGWSLDMSVLSQCRELPRCRSGRQTWFDQEDADCCCNPDCRRELRLSGTYARRVWVVVSTGVEERPTAWRSLL